MTEQNIAFEVKSEALAVIQTLDIEANFEEMRAYLTDMLSPYKSLVVTDMGAAKSARAYVNKVRKSIDDSRKMVKKLYTEPLAAFEDKCKALTAICDEASGAIDAQIKAEEQKEREQRIEALRNYFSSSAAAISDYITFESIYNPKWETKTYGMEKAEEDIDRAVSERVTNVHLIKQMRSPHQAALLSTLLKTGSMALVLEEKERLESIDAAEKQKQHKEKNDAESTEAPDPMRGYTPEPENAADAEKRFTFTLEFTVTREQAFMINDFFQKNHIKYRKMEGTK